MRRFHAGRIKAAEHPAAAQVSDFVNTRCRQVPGQLLRVSANTRQRQGDGGDIEQDFH